MDPLTHLVTTRLLVGHETAALLTGIAPDLHFLQYLPAVGSA